MGLEVGRMQLIGADQVAGTVAALGARFGCGSQIGQLVIATTVLCCKDIRYE